MTVEGRPLEMGRITFLPVDPSGRQSAGAIVNGEYRLTTANPGDGAKPGEYSVVIDTAKVIADGTVAQSVQDELKGIGANTRYRTEYLANSRYSARMTTDLTATVVESGDNRIDFVLDP